MRVLEDFALGPDPPWIGIAGVRAGWRPAPEVTLSGETWFGSSLRSVGAFARLRPWIGRGWPADLAFDFGLESIDADDSEDRGPAFAFGISVERRVGRRGTLEVGARHHFLTVDEEEVDGIATGRDTALWEIRAGIGVDLGSVR
jgi:hypothetical protein